ncbi:MAG: hypothetical protein GF381_00845 [Candidatus Pacebacteria bacterium]|nr:hypothetical protein [Candidatus Paceibacterota bacterium]
MRKLSKRKLSKRILSNHWFNLLLILVFFLGFFVRFFQLGQVPASLYWDETAMLVDAKLIAQTGRDMHGNSWLQPLFVSYGDYKLPVYIWLASLSVKLFGPTQFALRLPSALAGVGTVLVGWLLVRKLFGSDNKLAQLGVVLVLAISPWAILFSRTGFEGHLGQLFLASAVLLLAYKPRSILTALLAQVLASLATYSYFSVRFVWPCVFLFSLVLLNWQTDWKKFFKNKKWIYLIPIAATFIVYWLSLQPMFNSPLYQASNQYRFSTKSVLNMEDWALKSNQLRELAGNTLLSRAIYHRHLLMLRELAKNFADHLSFNYLFISGDSNLRHGTGRHGLFLWPWLVPFLAGLYAVFKKRWQTGLLLLVWWLLALLPASVPETTPHALRSLNALIPLAVIIGFGFSWLTTKSSLKLVRLWVLVLATIFIQFCYHYFLVYPQISAKAWQAGYRQTARVVSRLADDVDHVYFDLADNRIFLWVLAFGDYQPQKIQSELQDKNQLEELDTIKFDGFSWEQFELDHERQIVVSPKTNLEPTVEPNWKINVKTVSCETDFVIMGFSKHHWLPEGAEPSL